MILSSKGFHVKECSKCNKEKLLSEFYKDKRKKDGHFSMCKGCIKDNMVEYRYSNKEKHKEWRDKNKELIRLRNKKFYNENKDKIRKQNSEYKRTDVGVVVSTLTRQRYRDAVCSTDDGTVTTESLLNLREEQNHKCYHCGKELDYETSKAVHLDHLVPLSKGGTHTISNVRWSCAYCNLSKGCKII